MNARSTVAAGGIATGIGTLPAIVDAVPPEWGALGVASVVVLWFVHSLHSAAMAEILAMRGELQAAVARLVSLGEGAAERTAQIAAMREWIGELRQRSHVLADAGQVGIGFKDPLDPPGPA